MTVRDESGILIIAKEQKDLCAYYLKLALVCVPLSNDEPGLFEIQATLRLYAESILQVLFVLCWLRYRKRPGRSAKQSGETIAAFETFLSGK